MIDKRRERHRSGESSSFSWDEVKQQARRAAAENTLEIKDEAREEII